MVATCCQISDWLSEADDHLLFSDLNLPMLCCRPQDEASSVFLPVNVFSQVEVITVDGWLGCDLNQLTADCFLFAVW